MPDIIYQTGGWLAIQASDVTVTGPNIVNNLGDPGTQLNWSNSFPQGGTLSVTDTDGDGQLVAGLDTVSANGFSFSGYTVSANGLEFPIFTNATNSFFYIAVDDVSAFNNAVGASGTSNVYQNPENSPNLYLCFAEGTAIASPNGEVAVESLAIGDRVLTAEGRSVAVKWIGRQTVMTLFGPAERSMPVRFAAGSLGDGLPHNDLTVTADHGMLVDDVICHAGALVNGTTITRVPLAEMGESYTVYHIETEAHEIILANGAPAETFIDNVSRRAFDNFAEFETLYGDVPEMEELPYPRAMSARQVPLRLRAKFGLVGAA
ncbi:Hint domain-containing protein [Nioella sp.]|uniref:Hint domain-containing protein n=1 Tax=Nioella sp. TaxID=1912091 RepID=UPI003B528C2D